MRVLIINGSPRGERSNTLRLANAFVGGFGECESETVHLAKRDIKPCMGCFSCWTKTPGSCVIKDDMREILAKLESADIIIESFPLYFFGMPGLFKTFTDRCLPLMKTYLGSRDEGDDRGGAFHQLRKPAFHGKKLAVISTCGYVDAEPMYPALKTQYDLICGGDYTFLCVSEGELLGYDGLAERQKRGLYADFKNAGAEFFELGKLSEATLKRLSKPLLSAEGFEKIVRSHWGGEPY